MDFSSENRPVSSGSHVATSGSWFIRALGKGCKTRLVPVATLLLEELSQILALEGRSPDPRASHDRPLLLAGIGTRGKGVERRRLSGQGLYWQLKSLFKKVAIQQAYHGRRQDADALERASTHWLRHTHGSHAVAAGVPIEILQQNLGHRSIATSTIYVKSDLMRRVEESRRLRLPPTCR
jgi:site-specific recombinase XerD